MPAGRPKKGSRKEFDKKRSKDFFERIVQYLEENEDEYFIQGALLHMTKQDKQRYHKNTPYNIINKFKNRDSKEDQDFGSELEEIYLYCKDIVEYRIASRALDTKSNVYAGQAQFTLMNNHGWSSNHKNTSDLKIQGTGKVVIKSEGEDPEVS